VLVRDDLLQDVEDDALQRISSVDRIIVEEPIAEVAMTCGFSAS
jgi:hypothetical protein